MQTLDILPMELLPEKVALLLPRILYSRLVLQASPHGSLLLPPKYPRMYPGRGGAERTVLRQPCGLWCSLLPGPPGPCAQAVISVLHHPWVTRGEAWPTDHLEAADDVKKIHIRYRDGGHTNSNKSDYNGRTPNAQILDLKSQQTLGK